MHAKGLRTVMPGQERPMEAVRKTASFARTLVRSPMLLFFAEHSFA
jgi:hypothetical protein